MSFTNKGAWVPGKGQNLEVGPAESTSPGQGELVVKNHAIAINPIEWKMQSFGLFIQKYPTLLGSDLAGEVVEVGEGVSRFKKGDRVFAHALALANGTSSNAAYQNYTITKEIATGLIPSDMSFEKAAVLPMGMATASMGLFMKGMLELPLPSASSQKTGKTIVVWGGSSSVGGSAIQLATAAGVDVIATASKANFDYCKKLGAKEVFDYKSSSIVGDLTAALKDSSLAGGYDAISANRSTLNMAQVFAQLGGGKIVATLESQDEIPATVTVERIFGPGVFVMQPEIGKSIFEYLPEALKSGQIKAMPEAQVVGQGLDSIQTALDKSKAGVSATKLVVSL